MKGVWAWQNLHMSDNSGHTIGFLWLSLAAVAI